MGFGFAYDKLIRRPPEGFITRDPRFFLAKGRRKPGGAQGQRVRRISQGLGRFGSSAQGYEIRGLRNTRFYRDR